MISLRSLLALGLAALALAPAAAFGQSYRNYTQIAQLLADAEAQYPTLCRRVSIGTSVQNRTIWALNISDNVGTEEDEPELKYVSTMHGNEWTGNEMMLYLIDELLSNYGTDPELTNLVDEMDIWIVPVMNPDGFAIPQRENAHGYDLNRSFPDRIDDPVNTTVGREAEVAAIMNWSFGESFTLSANFHTGTMVVNYPYDNNESGASVYTTCPDDALFIYISEQYSQHNLPMWNGDFFHGITNGADWYTVSGGMQDWNYHWMGDNEVTIELSDSFIPSASQIPTYWSNNRDALIAYMSTGLIGIRGLVTDAETGAPIAATVTVEGNTHPVYTDPDVGDYHRMLLPGTYNLTFSAPGYANRTISNIVVTAGEATRRNVTMSPPTPPPAIVEPTLPHGLVNVAYGPVTLTADNGSPPLVWSMSTLPTYAETSLGTNAFAVAGTAMNWRSDDAFFNYNLPFPFPFYGIDETTVRVSPNGYINFGAINGSTAANTTALLISNRRIAPLWDDLKTNPTGKDIYVDATQPDRVTIRWDAYTYSGNKQVDVAVTLFADGRIQFHYGPSNVGLSPTLGISSGDGTHYTLASYNGLTTLTSLDSIEFAPSSVLPAGMSFSSGGVLSGTPTEAGNFIFQVTVTDSEDRTDTATLSLTVDAPSADGDYNGDGAVDLADFAAFQECMGAAPEGACADAFEYIPDGAIDVADLAVFTSQLTGPAH